MKRVFLSLILFWTASFASFAQTLDDVGRLSINVAYPKNQKIPKEALDLLDGRMHQFISQCGIVDNGIDKRFSMSADVFVLSKDIIAGSPSRISQNLEVSFKILDVFENKSYGEVAINVVGIGINENKSFIMAFNNLKSNNQAVRDMIESAKRQIVIYYKTNAERIISHAYSISETGEFDEAIYRLAMVPDICAEAFDKCQDAMLDIFQKKIDYEGSHLLSRAKAFWAESPDADGASRATECLARISVMASCQPEVNLLLNEITNKIKDDQRKAWEFTLQQYADQKSREQRDFEFKVRQYEDAEAKEERRHQEYVQREQRDFDFSVHKFNAEMGFRHAVVDASKTVALEFAKNM